MTDKALKIIADLKKAYAETPEVYSAILFGKKGVGKTNCLRTAVAPILLFSFDPQGHNVLRDEIDSGRVIPALFEKEDPRKPHIFTDFDRMFTDMLKANLFEKIGTIAIDSITTLSEYIMLDVLRKANRLDSYPQQNDYPLQMSIIRKIVLEVTGTPCHSIFIGHTEQLKDDVSGLVQTVPELVGKLKNKIPLLFSEMYFVDAGFDDKGDRKTTFQTQGDKRRTASSRLGKAGLLDKIEPADFKYLLKKAGRDHSDKPLLNGAS